MPYDPNVATELANVLASFTNACHAASDDHVCYCDDEGLDGDLCHVCKCRKAINQADQFSANITEGK